MLPGGGLDEPGTVLVSQSPATVAVNTVNLSGLKSTPTDNRASLPCSRSPLDTSQAACLKEISFSFVFSVMHSLQWHLFTLLFTVFSTWTCFTKQVYSVFWKIWQRATWNLHKSGTWTKFCKRRIVD